MNRKLGFTTLYATSVLVMIASQLANVAMASTNEGPRSDRACEEMVTLEGKQDARTEPDSPIPDNPIGSQKGLEGATKAADGCDLQTD